MLGEVVSVVYAVVYYLIYLVDDVHVCGGGLRVVVAGSCYGHDVLLECQTAVDVSHSH